MNRNRRQGQEPVDFDKLATQTLTVVQERTGWTSRQAAIAVSAGVVITLLACIALSAGVLAVAEAHPLPTATLVPLPTSTASFVLAHFKQAGLTVGATKNLTLPNASWQAHEGLQFTVQQADKQGTFLMLSYDTIQQAELDAFMVGSSAKWKDWHSLQVVNVLLLGQPDNNPAVEIVVEQQLSQALIAPYRDVPTPVIQL